MHFVLVTNIVQKLWNCASKAKTDNWDIFYLLDVQLLAFFNPSALKCFANNTFDLKENQIPKLQIRMAK